MNDLSFLNSWEDAFYISRLFYIIKDKLHSLNIAERPFWEIYMLIVECSLMGLLE